MCGAHSTRRVGPPYRPSRFQGTFNVSLPSKPAWKAARRRVSRALKRETKRETNTGGVSVPELCSRDGRTVTVMGSRNALSASGRSCQAEESKRADDAAQASARCKQVAP